MAEVNASVVPPSEASQTAYHWTVSSHQHTVSIGVAHGPARADTLADDVLESAVYAHIQALRRLGKTKTHTVEIAQALGLRLPDVERVVRKLMESDGGIDQPEPAWQCL